MRVSVITPSIRPEFLHITQEALEAQTDQDFDWEVQMGLRNRGFTLPQDWNKLLKHSEGDIIFILQDCISIPPDTIAKIKTLDLDKKAYTFPICKEGEYDWRNGVEKKLTPNEWEADLAVAPRSMFYDVGGFDERFSEGWSWENVELAWRAEAAGYEFYCSHLFEGSSIDHDKVREHPFRTSLPHNAPRANETMEKARRGKYKLNYLY